MSKFSGKFDIFPQIYALFCRILLRQMFTHFFKSSSKKFATYMFKTREGGQRPFEQCLKKLHNWYVMASLMSIISNSTYIRILIRKEDEFISSQGFTSLLLLQGTSRSSSSALSKISSITSVSSALVSSVTAVSWGV